jgi:hypothetical protein
MFQNEEKSHVLEAAWTDLTKKKNKTEKRSNFESIHEFPLKNDIII